MSVKIKENPPVPAKQKQVQTGITSVKKARRPAPVKQNQLTKETAADKDLPQQKTTALSNAQVVSRIHTALQQYFVYPKLAQKRNWQGKVLLSLRLSANGNIHNIELKQSSGYSVLDQAAIDALLKVKSIPPVSSWLPGDIQLQLPVIYRLTEG